MVEIKEIKYLSKNDKGFSIDDITMRYHYNFILNNKIKHYFLNEKKKKVFIIVKLIEHKTDVKKDFYEIKFLLDKNNNNDLCFFTVKWNEIKDGENHFEAFKRILKFYMLKYGFKEKYKTPIVTLFDDFNLNPKDIGKKKEIVFYFNPGYGENIIKKYTLFELGISDINGIQLINDKEKNKIIQKKYEEFIGEFDSGFYEV